MDQVRVDRFERISGTIKKNTACPGNDIRSDYDVPTMEECMRRCARMHYCRAAVYTPWANSKRCSFKTACNKLETKKDHQAAVIDGVKLNEDKSKRKTRSCLYGNGQGYIGDVSRTAGGEKCSSPCRNPNGAWSLPKCPTIATGEHKDCAIARCVRSKCLLRKCGFPTVPDVWQ